jgi:hypothetical protein
MKAIKAALSLLTLVVSAMMWHAAAADDSTTFTAVLAYRPESRSPETSRVFRSHGKAYRFRLVSDRDADGSAGNFELILERATSPRPPNLLDPTGMLHGYQRWDFGAFDFANGARKSIYGPTRVMSLPKRGLVVRVDVLRVAVKSAPVTKDEPAGHRFTALTLRIVARAVPIGAR